MQKKEIEMADGLVTLEGVVGHPGDGPYIILQILVSSNCIVGGSYRANNCPAAQIAAQGLLNIIRGRTVEQASGLNAKSLEFLVGGLPAGKSAYASMAVEALLNALNGLEPVTREPKSPT